MESDGYWMKTDDFADKPIPPDQLVRRIEKLVGGPARKGERAARTRSFGTVVCVGGGIGVAPVPHRRGAQEGREQGHLDHRREDEGPPDPRGGDAAASDELIVTTDDGSYGRKGFVTDALAEVIGGAGRSTASWRSARSS